jgi:hypothetical protein
VRALAAGIYPEGVASAKAEIVEVNITYVRVRSDVAAAAILGAWRCAACDAAGFGRCDEVARRAEQFEDIMATFRRRAKQFHPDHAAPRRSSSNL